MMNRQLVAFCGELQSGKTTAAKHLEAMGFVRLRFAGPLKDMMRALGCTYDEIDGDKKEVPCTLLGGQTPRHAMQTLGTEWGRHQIHPALWVNAWRKQAEAEIAFGNSVVVDDVRFQNEVDAVHALGGKVWRIVRFTQEPGSKHASEDMAFTPNGYIVNDGTVADLQRRVEELTLAGQSGPRTAESLSD